VQIEIETPFIREAMHYEELAYLEKTLKEVTGQDIQTMEIEPTPVPKPPPQNEDDPQVVALGPQYAAIYYLSGEKIEVDAMVDEGQIKPCEAY